MTPIQKAKLIQEEYEARRKSVSNPTGINQHSGEVGDEIHHQAKNKTRREVAAEHSISEHQVQKAVELGRGIDKAATVDPDFKREVLSGEIKARRSDIAADDSHAGTPPTGEQRRMHQDTPKSISTGSGGDRTRRGAGAPERPDQSGEGRAPPGRLFSQKR